MLIGFGSVPSSGRPACETTRQTSGIDKQLFAHAVQRSIHLARRDSRRKSEVHPDAALVQFGQKFGAELRNEHQGSDQRNTSDKQHDSG